MALHVRGTRARAIASRSSPQHFGASHPKRNTRSAAFGWLSAASATSCRIFDEDRTRRRPNTEKSPAYGEVFNMLSMNSRWPLVQLQGVTRGAGTIIGLTEQAWVQRNASRPSPQRARHPPRRGPHRMVRAEFTIYRVRVRSASPVDPRHALPKGTDRHDVAEVQFPASRIRHIPRNRHPNGPSARPPNNSLGSCTSPADLTGQLPGRRVCFGSQPSRESKGGNNQIPC